MVAVENCEEVWKKVAMAHLRYFPSIFWEGPRKIRKNLRLSVALAGNRTKNLSRVLIQGMR
jgi:hypothetical protein